MKINIIRENFDMNRNGEVPKGFIYLALADPQKIFKQHLIKKEEQISYSKIHSVHFGEASTMQLFT